MGCRAGLCLWGSGLALSGLVGLSVSLRENLPTALDKGTTMLPLRVHSLQIFMTGRHRR